MEKTNKTYRDVLKIGKSVSNSSVNHLNKNKKHNASKEYKTNKTMSFNFSQICKDLIKISSK